MWSGQHENKNKNIFSNIHSLSLSYATLIS